MTKKNSNKKVKTTYDRFIESLTPKELAEFEQEYKEFLISEMLLAAMKEDQVSVRELAKLAGISPSIIQGLRSGDQKNVTIKSFVKILKALNCSLVVEKNGLQFPLELPKK